MALKNGQKLINYWADAETVKEYQELTKIMGYYPSRMLFVLISMFNAGSFEPVQEEMQRRYDARTAELRTRRISRLPNNKQK